MCSACMHVKHSKFEVMAFVGRLLIVPNTLQNWEQAGHISPHAGSHEWPHLHCEAAVGYGQ